MAVPKGQKEKRKKNRAKMRKKERESDESTTRRCLYPPLLLSHTGFCASFYDAINNKSGSIRCEIVGEIVSRVCYRVFS